MPLSPVGEGIKPSEGLEKALSGGTSFCLRCLGLYGAGVPSGPGKPWKKGSWVQISEGGPRLPQKGPQADFPWLYLLTTPCPSLEDTRTLVSWAEGSPMIPMTLPGSDDTP